MHVQAGGRPQGAVVGHEAGVGVGVGVAGGVGVGVPGGGVGVGVPGGGVGVGVPGGGVGVGVPGGVGVGPPGVGVGVAPTSSFQTARSGFIFSSSGTSVTAGSSNVGMLSPPYSIATVPAGEMKITFEFSAFAVSGVQLPLQKNNSGIVAVGTEAGSQSLMKAWPR
jgi:hypothetical protein